MDEEKKEISEPKVESKPGESPVVEQRVKDDDSSITDKVRENPWVLATLVLAVITLILLVGDLGSGTGAAIGTASQSEVETKTLDFLNSQVGGGVTLVSSSFSNGLYEVVVSFQGAEIPVYVTADGNSLIQSPPVSFDVLAQEASDVGAQQPTAVPKSDKPQVELFVMSMCPYGTQAEKGILSALGLLKDKIDFELRFVSYAMHGKGEIDENTVQYCIQKEEPKKLYDYLICYLNDQNPSSWEACRGEVGINEAKLQSCIQLTDTQFKITELYDDKGTWNGGTYPQFNIDADLNNEYGVQGSPTLVINGVQSNAGRSSASYLAGICAAFNDAPEECNEVLDTSSPSPGFGWSGTAASDTTALCG